MLYNNKLNINKIIEIFHIIIKLNINNIIEIYNIIIKLNINNIIEIYYIIIKLRTKLFYLPIFFLFF